MTNRTQPDGCSKPHPADCAHNTPTPWKVIPCTEKGYEGHVNIATCDEEYFPVENDCDPYRVAMAEADAHFIVEAANNHTIYKQKADMFDEFMPEVDKMIKEAYELDARLDVFNEKDRESLSFISTVLQNLQAFRDKAKRLQGSE